MTPGILDLLAPALGEQGLDAIAAQLGLGPEDTQRGVGVALPALLGQLKATSDNDVTGPALASAITQHHSGEVFDDLPAFLNGGHRAHAPAALATAFGRFGEDHTSGPIGAIARLAALGGVQTKALLGILAPLALGALSRLGGPGLDAGTASNLLGTSIQQLRRASPLDPFGAAGVAVAAAAPPSGSAPADEPDVDTHSAGGVLAAGGAVAAGAAMSRAAGPIVSSTRSMAPDAPAPAVVAPLSDEPERSKKRPVWMWLLPLALLVALAALLLSKCGSDGGSNGTRVTTPTSTATVTVPLATLPAAGSTSVASTDAVETTTSAAETTTTVAETTTVAAAPQPATVVEAATAQPNLSTFVAALSAAGLSDALQGPGPFSVFAPSNDAFAALPAGALDQLLKPENKDVLAQVLNYHLVNQRLEASTLVSGPVTNAGGATLTIANDGTTVSVADSAGPAAVSGAGLGSTNGVVYVIDRVLLPEGFVVPTPPPPVVVTNAAGDPVSDDFTIYFDTNSAAIKASEQGKIDNAVNLLRSTPGARVNVVGHADSRGNPASNQALSDARAIAVANAITAGLGADAANVTVTASATGDTNAAADPAVSRRVTIEIQS